MTKTPKELFDWYLTAPFDDIGWIDTRDHLETFRRMAKGEVLEIGVNTGISTSAFLLGIEENGGHLTSIDVRPDCGKVFAGHPNWTFIAGSSTDSIPDKDWDLVFIDGNHDYAYVKSDMMHVKKIGLMHDICATSSFPGVRQAFDEWPWKKEILSEKSYGLGLIYAERFSGVDHL